MTLPDLRAGIYQHYKGPLYLVLGYGHDANHDGRQVVIYVGLQLDGAHPGARLAVRDVLSAAVHLPRPNMGGPMTGDEIRQIIAERTAGHGGPLSRACFDQRCDECGLYGCHCRHHYVSAAQLQRIIQGRTDEQIPRIGQLRREQRRRTDPDMPV